MFSLYGVAGRVFNGPLDQLRRVRPVGGKPRVEALQDAEADRQVSLAWTAAGGIDGLPTSPPHEPPAPHRPPGLVGAYTQAAGRVSREPLRTVGDLMSQPAFTLAPGLSAREAWLALAARQVGQAPVLGADGALVGLVGRVELAPGPAPGDVAAHWQQPVDRLMRTPVPAVQPEAGLREAAQALVVTGLPGLPVVDASGRVLGFLSRTDLLRAVAQDPPLDLWA
jgi:CBS domain-containing protein